MVRFGLHDGHDFGSVMGTTLLCDGHDFGSVMGTTFAMSLLGQFPTEFWRKNDICR